MTAATAAVIQGGEVVNMIVVDITADRETATIIPGSDVVVLPDGSEAAIGWNYVDSQFHAPIHVEALMLNAADGTVDLSEHATTAGATTYTIGDVTDGVTVTLDGPVATVTATVSGQFTYTATDSLGRTASGTVTVNIPDTSEENPA